MKCVRAKKVRVTVPARRGGTVRREIPTFNGKAAVKEWRRFGFELQEVPLKLQSLKDFGKFRFEDDPYYGATAVVVGAKNGKDYLIYQNVTRRMREKLGLCK